MPSSTIEAFGNILVKKRIVTRDEIIEGGRYYDLLEEALKTKADPSRLRVVVYGAEFNASTGSMAYKEAHDANTGQVLTKPAPDDLMEIFMILKTSRDNELASKQREHDELTQKVEAAYYNYKRLYPHGDLTHEYFIENPFGCPLGICNKRFETQREALNHRMQHAVASY
jgi:hypothetical protein